MFRNIWQYIMTHKLAKDVFRANVLFILLVIIYDIFHFNLGVIGFALFFKWLILMNLCLIISVAFDHLNKKG